MILPPQLLEGFIAEARGHLHALREALAAEEGEALAQALHRQLDVLGGSAEVLGLTGIAEQALPLAEQVAAADKLDEGLLGEVKETLTTLEAEVDALNGNDSKARVGEQQEQAEKVTPRPAPKKPGTSPLEPPGLPDLPPELMEIFLVEAQEHIETVHAHLLPLEGNLNRPDDIRTIRRAVHTLKGAAASVGFDEMARYAHLMEDLLDEVLEGELELTRDHYHLLMDAADALTALMDPSLGNPGLLPSVDARFEALLGDDFVPADDTTPDTPMPTSQAGALLRIPLETIDELVNRIGEVVINHSVFDENLRSLRELIGDLGSTSQRIQRLAAELDERIESESLGVVSSPQDTGFDTIELDRYSALYRIARELEEIAADTSGLNDQFDDLAGDFNAALLRERRLTNELQEDLVAVRLMPFETVVPRLRQVVQRTARDLGKTIDFIVAGAETQVDKTILDALVDPLMHMLRNAIDHGIEPPEERINAGKSARGSIKLSVSRERGRVMVVLSDDGKGIDVGRVRERALQAGLFRPEETPDDRAVLSAIFADGFSMAPTITQTSGRGVGMNVVQQEIAALRGTVRVDTHLGRGTTFTLSLPITLTTIRAMFFGCAGRTYAVPLTQIDSVMGVSPEVLARADDDGILREDGRRYLVKELADFVSPSAQKATEGRRYGLVMDMGEYNALLIVDELSGIRETVVKTLGNHLTHVHGVTGATIGGDGSVILILEPSEIITGQTMQRVPAALPEATPSANVMHVLVVDDSPSVRRAVAGFLRSEGWDVTTARDGVEALDKLDEALPDALLVDIEMPRMNGYELLEHCRNTASLAGLPIVFLTSRSASKHRRRAEALGVNGYLVKPFREEELVDTLRKVAQRAMLP